MPTLHLICGLPGSGKTTLAKQLEEAVPALRLTPDEWMAQVVGDGYDVDKRAVVEALLAEIAFRVLQLGGSVILDFGFWSRSERDGFRRRASEIGAETQVHFLDVARDELIKRLAKRNAALPENTFYVDPYDLDVWLSYFECPTSDELE